MKKLNSEKIIDSIKAVAHRFPLTILLMGIMTARRLYFLSNNSSGNIQVDIAIVMGYWLSIIAQYVYEIYFDKRVELRWIMQSASLILSGLYYLYLSHGQDPLSSLFMFYSVTGIRTMILFFVIIVTTIMIPTLKNKMKFSESYLLYFRGTYTSFFFGLVLFLGVSAILALFKLLFYNVSFDAWIRTAIIIVNFFQPALFLAFLPKYKYFENEEEGRLENTDSSSEIHESDNMTSFLKNLVTFILVPISIVYTGVIVLYILLNIKYIFYTDNPLENLILNYTISGWILLALVDSLDHVLTHWFKKIFPVALIFVLALQVLSTFRQIQEVGVTHGRYLIILFGIGSIISASWYIFKEQDLKLVPYTAIIVGIVALIPGIDAAGLSVRNQVNRVEDTLNEYDVLKNGEIDRSVSADIPNFKQERILESIDYLHDINALDELSWFPSDRYYNAEDVLGFNDKDYYDNEYYEALEEELEKEKEDEIFASVDSKENSGYTFSVENYNHLSEVRLVSSDSKTDIYEKDFEIDGEEYTLQAWLDSDFIFTIYPKEENDALYEFDYTYIFEELKGVDDLNMSEEELTFTASDGDLESKILIRLINSEKDKREVTVFFMY